MNNKNKYIDHTILLANAKREDIDKIISEAIEYDFATICINPSWVEYAAKKLKGENPGITTVIGFPLGAMSTKAKVFEAKDAISNGADEIDMVMNIGKFKDKEYDYVLNEINSIKSAIGDKVLKVIVETALLDNNEIAKISKIVSSSKADFIKTSTGFSTRGASVEDVKIMSENINKKTTLIKAAGGVRTPKDLEAMIKNGASRIGTSKGVSLLEG
ncbi:MAG: deoxyribose-phosphate aldolase, partial [Mycoplasmataceae bacterium]|nr:deoxyribose-phosphate aldolase [Mycoplasmataceae bacterium]